MAECNQELEILGNCLDRIFIKKERSSKVEDLSKQTNSLSEYEDTIQEKSPSCSFEETIALMASIENKLEMPKNLPGGILVDHIYVVSPYDLNLFLFAPNSRFRKDLAELQGTTNVEEGPWALNPKDISCLKRVVTYTKAATKLVKAVNATEEQTYIRVTREEFSVLFSISMPEVPFGNKFRIELLYKVMPGGISYGDVSSHFVVTWAIVFLQSTILKGIIERGVQQGMKESFDQFCNLLAQNFEVL
ncbi:hypothetical protein TanjilG_15786 [Lupinus angustifolius]|uniref:VASt domain-containing protein n=1 Tax=Lupinus angustifolius TaxID=3871 RepID=A0A1J7IRM5_LUPAN|nr:PREDICTED: C2 and GRAM domain-containing protein At5g50170-like [Lupinus angustifolius]OIW15403.1 hypothetical protein TanjilG_15786 [Lupinus angustifolius]